MTTRASDNTGAPQVRRASDRERSSACLRKVPLQRRRRARFLGTDNEVCHVWLVGALQQLRPEGHTKVVGYLEAILEEIVFEMKVPPGSCP